MTAFTQSPTDNTGLWDGGYYTNYQDVRNESMGLTDAALVVFTKGFDDPDGLSDTITLTIVKQFDELVNGATQDDIAVVALSSGGNTFVQTAMELVKLSDNFTLTTSKVFNESMSVVESVTVFRNPSLDFAVTDAAALSDSIAIYHEVVVDFESANDQSGQDDFFTVVLNPVQANFFTQTPTDSTGLTDNIAFTRNMVLDDPASMVDTFVLERRRTVLSVDARIG